jgi:hypothetical protein
MDTFDHGVDSAQDREVVGPNENFERRISWRHPFQLVSPPKRFETAVSRLNSDADPAAQDDSSRSFLKTAGSARCWPRRDGRLGALVAWSARSLRGPWRVSAELDGIPDERRRRLLDETARLYSDRSRVWESNRSSAGKPEHTGHP